MSTGLFGCGQEEDTGTTSSCVSIGAVSERSGEPGQFREVYVWEEQEGPRPRWTPLLREYEQALLHVVVLRRGRLMPALCRGTVASGHWRACAGTLTLSFPLGTSWRPLPLELALHDQQDGGHPRM